MTNQNPEEGLRQRLKELEIEFLHGVPVSLPDIAIDSIMELVTAYAATVEREARFSEAFHIAKMESVSGEPEADNRIAEAWNGAALQGPREETDEPTM